jgi:hypothetical protein
MSFLTDPPWLYANGRVIAQAVPPERRRPPALATIGVFVVTGISLSLDKGWTKPIWRLCRARSGRDRMLNSGVFKRDPDRAGTPTHAVSAAIFAAYPFWLWPGLRHDQD